VQETKYCGGFRVCKMFPKCLFSELLIYILHDLQYLNDSVNANEFFNFVKPFVTAL
jgi:hypothetical protein